MSSQDNRRLYAEYARLVAEGGSGSGAAKQFRADHGRDPNLAQLMRLVDFTFAEAERQGLIKPPGGPT